MKSARIFALVMGAALLAPAAMAADTATADLYKSKCQLCHGAEGKGDTPAGKKFEARDFTSADVKKESDADLLKVMKEGKKKMPAYEKKLSDDQLKALVAYVRELANKK
jgi:cytochrome c6